MCTVRSCVTAALATITNTGQYHPRQPMRRSTPVDTVVYFGDKIVQWVSKVKYLGLYVTSGSEFKIDSSRLQVIR